jgi:hypothetical protein
MYRTNQNKVVQPGSGGSQKTQGRYGRKLKNLKLWDDRRNWELLYIGPYKWKQSSNKNKTVTYTIMTQLIKNDLKL